MIHYGSGGIYDAEWQVLCEVYKGVLLESLRKKHPKFKESKLEEWLLHPHTWFSAQEAASYGFIDEVL
jgi:ATP-dependent protease ClpP protease subunit